MKKNLKEKEQQKHSAATSPAKSTTSTSSYIEYSIPAPSLVPELALAAENSAVEEVFVPLSVSETSNSMRHSDSSPSFAKAFENVDKVSEPHDDDDTVPSTPSKTMDSKHEEQQSLAAAPGSSGAPASASRRRTTPMKKPPPPPNWNEDEESHVAPVKRPYQDVVGLFGTAADEFRSISKKPVVADDLMHSNPQDSKYGEIDDVIVEATINGGTPAVAVGNERGNTTTITTALNETYSAINASSREAAAVSDDDLEQVIAQSSSAQQENSIVETSIESLQIAQFDAANTSFDIQTVTKTIVEVAAEIVSSSPASSPSKKVVASVDPAPATTDIPSSPVSNATTDDSVTAAVSESATSPVTAVTPNNISSAVSEPTTTNNNNNNTATTKKATTSRFTAARLSTSLSFLWSVTQKAIHVSAPAITYSLQVAKPILDTLHAHPRMQTALKFGALLMLSPFIIFTLFFTWPLVVAYKASPGTAGALKKRVKEAMLMLVEEMQKAREQYLLKQGVSDKKGSVTAAEKPEEIASRSVAASTASA
jgi:hypothetical protein